MFRLWRRGPNLDARPEGQRYRAFISYRWGPPGQGWAEWLWKALWSYRVPKQFRVDGASRIWPVFLDRRELSAGGELDAILENAVDHADHLIVISTPGIYKSTYVKQEVERFHANYPEFALDRISALLVEGNLDPEGGIWSHGIPTAADVRRLNGHPWLRSPNHSPSEQSCTTRCLHLSCLRRRHEAKLRIIARLLGCKYPELEARDRKRRRRLATLYTAAVLVTGLVLWATWYTRHEMPALAERYKQQLDATIDIDNVPRLVAEIGWLKETVRRIAVLLPDSLAGEVAGLSATSRELIRPRELNLPISQLTSHWPAAVSDARGKAFIVLDQKSLIYVPDITAGSSTEVPHESLRLPQPPIAWNAVCLDGVCRAVVVHSSNARRLVATIYEFPGRRSVATREIASPEVPFRAVVSPAAKKVALLSARELRVWTLDRNEVQLWSDEAMQGDATFSPSGEWVMVRDGIASTLYSPHTSYPAEPATAIAFTNDERYLAIVPAQTDTRIRLWNLNERRYEHRSAVANATIKEFALSPTASQVVAFTDKGISFWFNLDGWTLDSDPTGEIALPVGDVRDLMGNPEDGAILFGVHSFDDHKQRKAIVQIASRARMRQVRTFSGFGASIRALLPLDGYYVVISDEEGNGNRVRTRVLETAVPNRSQVATIDVPVDVAAVTDSGVTAFSRWTGGVSICEPPAACRAVQIPGERVTRLDLSANGRWLATLAEGEDGAHSTLSVLRQAISTWTVQHQYPLGPDSVFAVGPDGRVAWSQGPTSELRLISSGGKPDVSCSLPGQVKALGFSDDAGRLAVALEESKTLTAVHIGRLQEGCPTWTHRWRVQPSAAALERLRFSSDGTRVLLVERAAGDSQPSSGAWIFEIDGWIRLRSRIEGAAVKDVRLVGELALVLSAPPRSGGVFLDKVDPVK
jgi:hypothetical protein